MTEYRFVTTWCLDAPIERVFDAIDDAARWPEWWKGVSRAELLEPGAEDGVGRLWRYTWRSRLPYDLTFESRVTRREPPYLLEGDADGSELDRRRPLASCPRRPGDRGRMSNEWNVRTSRASDEPPRAGGQTAVRMESRRAGCARRGRRAGAAALDREPG